jgi:hypothetical protein
MPLKINGVLASGSEKKRQRQTNSGLTTDNLDLVHISSIGLQEVEGCYDLKSPRGED